VVQTDADGPVGAAVAALGKVSRLPMSSLHRSSPSCLCPCPCLCVCVQAMGVTVVGASPADIDDAKFAARAIDKGAVTLALCGTAARAASRALQVSSPPRRPLVVCCCCRRDSHLHLHPTAPA